MICEKREQGDECGATSAAHFAAFYADNRPLIPSQIPGTHFAARTHERALARIDAAFSCQSGCSYDAQARAVVQMLYRARLAGVSLGD